VTRATGTRTELLEVLVREIDTASKSRSHPLRVAVDGRPAAGKTTLADEVGAALRSRGRQVVRASIEGFLLPRSMRYRRGEDSPEGCFEDSFDFEALHRELLGPLGPSGDRRHRTAVYDRDTDAVVYPPVIVADEHAVLLFDGVFLLRPELIDRWDLRVFVSVAFEETLARALVRDEASLGSVDRVEERFRRRYLPSQARYLDAVRPSDLADVVVVNDRIERPTWEVRR